MCMPINDNQFLYSLSMNTLKTILLTLIKSVEYDCFTKSYTNGVDDWQSDSESLPVTCTGSGSL